MKKIAAVIGLLAAAGACRRAQPDREIPMAPAHADETASSAAPAVGAPASGPVRVAGIAFAPPASC
jgi:hypothetical protein